MIKKLGFMQGRLVNSEKKNAIQYFPEKNWPKELKIAKKINLKIMEWTINNENLKKNPFYNGELNKLKKLLKTIEFKFHQLQMIILCKNHFLKKKI
jgi:hypothetical protein